MADGRAVTEEAWWVFWEMLLQHSARLVQILVWFRVLCCPVTFPKPVKLHERVPCSVLIWQMCNHQLLEYNPCDHHFCFHLFLFKGPFTHYTLYFASHYAKIDKMPIYAKSACQRTISVTNISFLMWVWLTAEYQDCPWTLKDASNGSHLTIGFPFVDVPDYISRQIYN